MTLLYRVQALPVPDDDDPETPTWLSAWFATKKEALEHHKECLSIGWYVRTSEHHVPSDRESLCMALNLANVNFSVWEGETVRTDEPIDLRKHTALRPMNRRLQNGT